jgi:hypothetical protein
MSVVRRLLVISDRDYGVRNPLNNSDLILCRGGFQTRPYTMNFDQSTRMIQEDIT